MLIQPIKNQTNTRPSFQAIRVKPEKGVQNSLDVTLHALDEELAQGLASIKIKSKSNKEIEYFDVNAEPNAENFLKMKLIENKDEFIYLPQQEALTEEQFNLFHRMSDEKITKYFTP